LTTTVRFTVATPRVLSVMRPTTALLVALATLALLGTYFAAPAGAATFKPGFGKGSTTECTRTISSGSVEAAANSLGSGGVLCLRGGTYSESDRSIGIKTSGTATAPKKIKAYPGERAAIQSSFRFSTSGVSHWVIEGIFVDASYAPVRSTKGSDGTRTNTEQAMSFHSSSDITIDSVELINRRPNLDPKLAGTCLFLGDSPKSTDITVENSSIHQCGQLPRTNHEHCIYAADTTNLTVSNNRIYDCADRGVQLYPDADGSTIVGNLVDSNYQYGIDLDGDADNNVIRNNVVDTPNGNTIYTGGTYAGSGNVVKDNCVWNSSPRLASNVAASGNIVANPLISSYIVTGATCAAKLPTGSPFR
jgi:parallel beta-helix repeat protein